MKKKLKILGIITVSLAVFFICSVFGLNAYVVSSTKQQIQEMEDISGDYDCILVLGAGIWGDKPSPMLADRLDYAIELYKQGVAPKLLMSGDHGKEAYDEVNTMKRYAVEQGVPEEDIFMDHAGFSTYDSIYRAKHVFCVERMIVVTQEYHLHRALYIADRLSVEAIGVGADPRVYASQTKRELREVLARDKDALKCLIKSSAKYLGEPIDIRGNGMVTQ